MEHRDGPAGISELKNERERPWTLTENIFRTVWGMAAIVFRCTPRNFYGFRNQLLRIFKAKVGNNVQISRLCRIHFPWNLTVGDNSSIGDFVDVYPLGNITIGKNVCVSQYSQLIAGSHDRLNKMKLIKASINIDDGVWICYGAYVGPEVSIAANCVIGAKSVITKSTKLSTTYIGNPAREL
jgi:putative colanic acid biosynthesis acetyltransferase WcaF